jgi:hypothetical protein
MYEYADGRQSERHVNWTAVVNSLINTRSEIIDRNKSVWLVKTMSPQQPTNGPAVSKEIIVTVYIHAIERPFKNYRHMHDPRESKLGGKCHSERKLFAERGSVEEALFFAKNWDTA